MNKEIPIQVSSGWSMLYVNLGLLLLAPLLFFPGIALADRRAGGPVGGALIFGGVLAGVAAMILLKGHFTLQPNQARVLMLFGAYQGTVRQPGFYWTNPFYSKALMSLRLRNMESEKLKVNDKQGNPIEIAAVVVWRVEDTAEASFDVDNYEQYVKIQSESAVRHLANSYAYDHGEEHETTLRSGVDEVSA
ncbi:MAG: SPFH domain-containing protein, partial [Pirellulales bacterium]